MAGQLQTRLRRGVPGRLRTVARHAARSDEGLSLLELVVGLVIMTIFMTMFTAASMMMYNASSKTEALADNASQLSIAFNRLDRSVRYASAISTPGPSGGDWYVEWLTTYTGSKNCTQVRLNATAGQLQQRTWSVVDGTATSVTQWLPLASELTATDPATGAAVVPFALSASPVQAVTDIPYQQLTFHLVAAATGRTGVTTTVSDVTFTAFNSDVVNAGPICAEEGRG